jgi:hypothetical protein
MKFVFNNISAKFMLQNVDKLNFPVFYRPMPVQNKIWLLVIIQSGRGVSRAVRHRFITMVGRVQSQVSSCGIFGGQNGTGTGSLPVGPLRIPLQISCVGGFIGVLSYLSIYVCTKQKTKKSMRLTPL